MRGPSHSRRSSPKGSKISPTCAVIASKPALSEPMTPGGGGSACSSAFVGSITNQFYHARRFFANLFYSSCLIFDSDRDDRASCPLGYNAPVESVPRNFPPSNQVGVLAATVLISYALAHLVSGPGVLLTIQLPGFFFAYSLNLGTAMTLLAGGLMATGMDWLLRGHPHPPSGTTAEHWMLPTLTAVIIGIVLDILPSGSAWWIGLLIGAALLIIVLVAEYVTVDPGAPFYALAAAGLTALSYALFLLFVIALRLAAARLFLVVPTVFVASGLVTLRSLHLRLFERWEYPWAFAIGLVCAQVAAGLHYWPLAPVQFGLIVLGPLYALTSLASVLVEDMPLRGALREPAIILAGLWAAAALLR